MSNGDPHIVTIDDTSYDFMAAGEFVALRSGDGSFELQARHEPYGTSRTISINTALALRAGSSRIGLYATDLDTLEVRVDGALVDPVAGPVSVQGVTVSHVPAALPSVEVAFADGTRLMAFGEYSYGINVTVDPSDALRQGAVGLMGPVPPDSLGVPALPDGTVLPEAFGTAEYHEQLYGPFEEAWRVTSETTLFDYGPGETTATYNLPDFPVQDDILTLDELTGDQLAAGQAACAQITVEILRQQCIYDVAVTGETLFGDLYDLSANIVESGSILPTGQQYRVVNLYANGGVPTSLDVYAWTDAGGALVATVPYGKSSDWFDPGSYTDEFTGLAAGVSAQRQGEPLAARSFNLYDFKRGVSPGIRSTLVVGTGDEGFSIVGGTPAAFSEHIEQLDGMSPMMPVPPEGALLFADLLGLTYTHPGVTFWASAGDGCLSQAGFDGLGAFLGVTGESGGIWYEGPLPVDPGTGLELTLHEAHQGDDPFAATCDAPPIHGPVQFDIAAGEGAHLFIYATPGDPTLRSLILPFGD